MDETGSFRGGDVIGRGVEGGRGGFDGPVRDGRAGMVGVVGVAQCGGVHHRFVGIMINEVVVVVVAP